LYREEYDRSRSDRRERGPGWASWATEGDEKNVRRRIQQIVMRSAGQRHGLPLTHPEMRCRSKTRFARYLGSRRIWSSSSKDLHTRDDGKVGKEGDVNGPLHEEIYSLRAGFCAF